MVVFYRPTQAKLARWASLLAEDDFELRHRPGHTNAVLDVLSRQPVPEETKNENDASSASFIDTLPHVAVSAYLVAVSLLCPYQLTPIPPTTSAKFMLAVTRATADPSNSSSSEDIRPSTPSLSDEPFTYLCSHRHDFINLQIQDPTLKVISKYQSAGSQKSAVRNLPSREQSRIQNMARRCVLLEGLIMYSDKFLGDPGHFRIFVPDNKDVKSKLLQAYHDSPLGMHQGRNATYHALARDFYLCGKGKATKRWVARCLECLKYKSVNQQQVSRTRDSMTSQ